MFKNKMYLYGLGVGLIIGAIVLQLMNIALHQETSIAAPTPVEELDHNQLRKQASEHYQVFDKQVKVYTQTELDAELSKHVQEEKAKLATAAPVPAPTPSVTEIKQTIVYVQPNLTASNVSELLYRSGIITDRTLFETEMAKQQMNSKIQVGPHLFTGTPDIQAIITNLLSKP